ncbi:MAG: zinc-ribbon domain-containing protein [Desulfovibrio sp.]|jgi:predicted Zn finger-like uncharacterized protein|nr:zinc-ribbon domain-containing protein [Desulfovibrio sp.]
MNIRCPRCEYSRTVSTAAIPATAETAVCPKCGHRFRFRALEPDFRAEAPADPSPGGLFLPANQGPRADPDPREETAAWAGQRERQMDRHPAGSDLEASKDAPTPHCLPGEVPVEERVERDLLLLRQEEERPMRDLGRLEADFPDHNGAAQPDLSGGTEFLPDPDAPPRSGEGIPWENPAALGWFRSFTRTLNEVMFNPPAFFSRLGSGGSLAPEYLFFLILGSIALISATAWTQAALFFLPHLQEDFPPRASLPLLILVAPIALGLMLLFVAGGIRLLSQLLAPEPADFSLVFRVVSYAVAPFILSIVPFVGPVVGAIWFLAALLAGCRHGLGLSWRRAAGVSLPPALLFIYGVIWFFLL